MELIKECGICGIKIGKYKCRLCGIVVCEDCFDMERGLCVNCSKKSI